MTDWLKRHAFDGPTKTRSLGECFSEASLQEIRDLVAWIREIRP